MQGDRAQGTYEHIYIYIRATTIVYNRIEGVLSIREINMNNGILGPSPSLFSRGLKSRRWRKNECISYSPLSSRRTTRVCFCWFARWDSALVIPMRALPRGCSGLQCGHALCIIPQFNIYNATRSIMYRSWYCYCSYSIIIISLAIRQCAA